MDRHQFELLHGTENSWWYQGRASVVVGLLERLPFATNLLDFGAGFGGMYSSLKKRASAVYAFEPDSQANESLVGRGYAGVFKTSEEALQGRYDIIGLFDVLEHIENDSEFLVNVQKSLAEKGAIVLTVPAYAWLWSPLDIASQHRRRYTRGMLKKKLEGAGYRVRYSGYWNMFLFPVAALVRLSGSAGEAGLTVPPFLNYLLVGLIRLECVLMRFFSLPFGLSIVAVAEPFPSRYEK